MIDIVDGFGGVFGGLTCDDAVVLKRLFESGLVGMWKENVLKR